MDLKYIILLLDYDTFDPVNWIDGHYFTVRNSMPDNRNLYPTTIPFSSGTIQVKFTFNVEWIQISRRMFLDQDLDKKLGCQGLTKILSLNRFNPLIKNPFL